MLTLESHTTYKPEWRHGNNVKEIVLDLVPTCAPMPLAPLHLMCVFKESLGCLKHVSPLLKRVALALHPLLSPQGSSVSFRAHHHTWQPRQYEWQDAKSCSAFSFIVENASSPLFSRTFWMVLIVIRIIILRIAMNYWTLVTMCLVLF